MFFLLNPSVSFMKILVVEDEKKIADFIKSNLEAEQFQVLQASSVEEVEENKYYKIVDLIVLDLMLEGKKSGLDLLRFLKKSQISVPVIVLTALNQISTKIELLNAGADDYLTKPFDSQEMLARIKSVYRRYLDAHIDDEVKIGECIFQRRENLIIRDGEKFFLTPKEGELLLFLLQNAGKVVRIEDILQKVWNAKIGFHSNIVQATVKRLRNKLEDEGTGKLIKNVHGVGYTLDIAEAL